MHIKATTFVALVIAFPLRAQVVEELTVQQKKHQSIVQEPLTTYQGFSRLGASIGYNALDRIFLSNGKKSALDGNISGNTWSSIFFFQYGVTNRFQVEVTLPYVSTTVNQSSNFQIPVLDSSYRTSWKVKGNGLADIQLRFGYQLIEGNHTKPALGFFITSVIPTGQKNITDVDPNDPKRYRIPTGNGEFSLTPEIMFRKIAYPLSYNLYVGYRYYFGGMKILQPIDKIEQDFKSGNWVYFGGSFNIHLNDWVIFKNFADLNLRSESTAAGKVSSESSWSFLYSPALNFQIKQFRIGEAMSIPVSGKLTGADIGYTLTFLYVF